MGVSASKIRESSRRRLPTADQWEHLVGRASEALAALGAHGPRIIELAALAGRDLPGNLRRDGGRGGAAEGGPTAALAILAAEGPPDPLAADVQLVRDSCGVLGLLVELSQRATTVAVEPAMPSSTLPIGAGDCCACGKFVPGKRDNRLRSGYCEAHYRRWCRSGRPDRGEFAAMVQAEQRAEWDDDRHQSTGPARRAA